MKWRGRPENWRGNELFLFLEINFAAVLSYANPSVIVIISLKWAARICGPLK